MISLARQLALRREIEEEMAGLSREGKREDERLYLGGTWRSRTDAERARDAAAARRRAKAKRLPCACGAPIPKFKQRCPVCVRRDRLAAAREAWALKYGTRVQCIDGCGRNRTSRKTPRCAPCRKRHRHVLDRIRLAKRRKEASRSKRESLRCLDCRHAIPEARTTLRVRCDPCAKKRDAFLQRERSRRWLERQRGGR